MALTGLATTDRAGDSPSVVAYTATSCKTVRLENWMGQVYEPPPESANDGQGFSCWEESEVSEYDKKNLA